MTWTITDQGITWTISEGATALDGLTDVVISSPSNGQQLTYNTATGKWVNSTAAGSGDVVGPASATNGAVALFDGTTGKLLKNSAAADVLSALGITSSVAELNFTDGVTSAIQTQLDSKLPASSYTAADVLTKLLTVDGAGSGLDADLLDGVQGSGYFNKSADDTDDITEGVKKFVTQAQKDKIDNITVTQAVDLDAIETRVNALDAAVVLKGTWDASAGTFPGGGTAQAGDSYIVSVGGTVDGVVFTANDRIIAITDNASTGTFAANWFKADYTDAVLSIDGSTGAVTIGAIIAASSSKATPVDADTFPLSDSEAGNATKKWSLANLKSVIKTYYDSVTATLTGKTINLANNTVTGTLAEFNTAISNDNIIPESGGTFTGDISVPNEAFGVGWNGNVEVPTKNAVYDEMELRVQKSAVPCEFIIACSDETTALTTGTAKVTFRAPYAFTVTGVRASVTTAPTGASLLTVDINENTGGGATSILSTKLTIDASEKTSTTAATPAVISDSAIADDAEITIDIDQIGSTIAGAGLKVTIIGTHAI